MTALVVTIAVAGAGKSTWLAARFTPFQIVNLDTLRGVISDDPGDREATGDAVDVQDRILGARCRRRRLTAVDATNLRPDVREKLTGLAIANLMTPVAVVFDIPEETCLARNELRREQDGRYVPPAVIERQAASFKENVPPTGSVPGFAQTVRVQADGSRVVFGLASTRHRNEPAPWLL